MTSSVEFGLTIKHIKTNFLGSLVEVNRKQKGDMIQQKTTLRLNSYLLICLLFKTKEEICNKKETFRDFVL